MDFPSPDPRRCGIYIVGEIATGKSTAIEICKSIFGANLVTIETSEVVIDAVKSQGRPVVRANCYEVALSMKRLGSPGIIAQWTIAKAYQESVVERRAVLVSGFRFMDDFDWACQHFPNNISIYLTASDHIRWQRSLHRGKSGEGTMTFVQFRQQEADMARNIRSIGARCSHVLVNDTDDKAAFARSLLGCFQPLRIVPWFAEMPLVL